MLEKFVQLAGDLGAAGVVVGPGKPNPLMPAPRERLTSYFLAALDRLAPVAARSGTALWVENMPFSFLPDASSIMSVLDGHGDPTIGIVYDLANGYFIREEPRRGLKAVKSRLEARPYLRHAPRGLSPFRDRDGNAPRRWSPAPPPKQRL